MSSVSMSLNGHKILIGQEAANPATLNHFLQKNGGYDQDNDLEEAVVPKISPARIEWVGPKYGLTAPEVKRMLVDRTTVVIANVMKGHHFVLVVGYDQGSTNFYVNDPGFDKVFYTMEEIVGWRIFKMK